MKTVLARLGQMAALALCLLIAVVFLAVLIWLARNWAYLTSARGI